MLNLLEFDPNLLAAILYRPEDDVDTLLADFASDLLKAGERVGGVVQQNTRNDSGKLTGMRTIDLMTGRGIGIFQTLGAGSTSCKLDASGLAEAASAVTNAIAADTGLIIVNKFSKQEASGGGLRSELASAIVAGRAVLTAVSEKCADAWKDFTGDRGTTLLCARRVVDSWWEEISYRDAVKRSIPLSGLAGSSGAAAITSRS
jgi:molybdate transport system ATP-binding protein